MRKRFEGKYYSLFDPTFAFSEAECPIATEATIDEGVMVVGDPGPDLNLARALGVLDILIASAEAELNIASEGVDRLYQRLTLHISGGHAAQTTKKPSILPFRQSLPAIEQETKR